MALDDSDSGVSLSSKQSQRRRRRGGSSGQLNGIENGQGGDNDTDEKYYKPKRTFGKKGGNNGDGSNMFVIILVLGLFFCFLDIAYMMGFIERSSMFQHHGAAPKSAPTSRGTIPKKKKRKLPQKRPEIFANTDTLRLRPYLKELKELSDKDDRRQILQLILEAGVREIDYETYLALPTWEEVSDLYGNEPHIFGLDQCAKFRNKGDPADHFLGTAGCFNTGTNLLSELLIHNCHMTERQKKYGMVNRGIRWQVPWGKHTPPGDEEFRLNHKTLKDAEVDANSILPALTIRDPYRWMQSMCRHKYTAEWVESDHCPKYQPDEMDYNNHPFLKKNHRDSFPVHVKYSDFKRVHKSLVHFYNDWYNEYRYNTTFPYIVIRFEDLLFFPKETTRIACECAGGSMLPTFTYQLDTAKKGPNAHGSNRTGYIDALIRYSTTEHRYDSFQEADLKYLNDHIDKDYMKVFHYPYWGTEIDTKNYGDSSESDSSDTSVEELLDQDFEKQHEDGVPDAIPEQPKRVLMEASKVNKMSERQQERMKELIKAREYEYDRRKREQDMRDSFVQQRTAQQEKIQQKLKQQREERGGKQQQSLLQQQQQQQRPPPLLTKPDVEKWQQHSTHNTGNKEEELKKEIEYERNRREREKEMRDQFLQKKKEQQDAIQQKLKQQQLEKGLQEQQ